MDARWMRTGSSSTSPTANSVGAPAETGGALRRASRRACLSARRSRSLLSRFSLDIVVFFLAFEAMTGSWDRGGRGGGPARAASNDGGPACGPSGCCSGVVLERLDVRRGGTLGALLAV